MILKWFTVVVFIGMGLGNLWLAGDMTYKSGQQIWLGYSSIGWPTVVGVIELSSVVKYPTSRGRIAYKPEIYYSYQVGKGLYTSNQIEFTMFGYGLKEASGICNEFQRGKPAVIHYEEDNPQMSSLTTGIKWDVFLALFIGLFWIIPSMILLALGVGASKKPANEFKPEYIAELKRRFRWRSKPNIWKPPAKL